MYKRGLLFLLVFIIFLQSSLAQDSCLLPSEENVPIIAERILSYYSQINLQGITPQQAAIDSVNRWQPPENIDTNWVNFKEQIKDEIKQTEWGVTQTNIPRLKIIGKITLFNDGREHRNCHCSYVSISDNKIVISSWDEEIKLKFEDGTPLFDVKADNLFEMTVRANSKIIINGQRDKIPIFRVFIQDSNEDGIKSILSITNGAINLELMNTGSFTSGAGRTPKMQSVPMQIIVYKNNRELKNKIITNYNEFLTSIKNTEEEGVLDDLGDMFIYSSTILNNQV